MGLVAVFAALGAAATDTAASPVDASPPATTTESAPEPRTTSAFGVVPDLNAVAPARFLETRAGLETVDGQFAGIGQRRSGQVTRLQVAGRGPIPDSGVDAVMMNVTAVDAANPGYAVVY
ncbi:MAG: hypothetical protein AAGA42_18450, partial [Actinomycetota bacterium]